MKWMVIALCAALPGCSLMESRQQQPPDVNGILNSAYQGGSIKAVMAQQGAPLRQMTQGDSTVYSWEQDRLMNFSSAPPARVHCQMDAYVTSQGVVSQIIVNGQMGACSAFLR
jgi:hypothetical protein